MNVSFTSLVPFGQRRLSLVPSTLSLSQPQHLPSRQMPSPEYNDMDVVSCRSLEDADINGSISDGRRFDNESVSESSREESHEDDSESDMHSLDDSSSKGDASQPLPSSGKIPIIATGFGWTVMFAREPQSFKTLTDTLPHGFKKMQWPAS